MEQPTNAQAKYRKTLGLALSGMVLIVVLVAAIFGFKRASNSSLPNQLPRATESVVEESARTVNTCNGQLILAHGFSAYQTNQDKTAFVELDVQNVGELRSFSWSPDGQQLALVGNTTGQGNIYLTDSDVNKFQLVPANAELPYLMGAAWSHDGRQLVAWEIQNNSTIYLVNEDGSSLVEKDLSAQMFETPQFAPGDESIVFYGVDSSLSDGLLEARVDGSQTRMISDLVENESSFAWSQDGSRLAYLEMDRNLGEARLVVEATKEGNKTTIATLPIPKGSGSSLPDSANLSWAPNGKTLVFEFGRSRADRVVYLAYADGTGLVKLAESAHAPAISADGKCLAYISDKQVFLLDLTGTPLNSATATPRLLAELPAGRQISDFRLDKLQWRPETLGTAGNNSISMP